MVEITAICDRCCTTMGSIDASEYLCLYRYDKRWVIDTATTSYCYPAFNMGGRSVIVDGEYCHLCGDCAKKLDETMTDEVEDRDEFMRDFLGIG